VQKDLKYEEAAALLLQSPDYKILRRLKPKTVFAETIEGDVLNAIVIDVETTGLDPELDEIIELAMIKFTFSRVGQVGRVTESYHSFNQPATRIPEAITRLTGITDNDVADRKISSESVESFIADSVLVIAHNAAFDRPFAERVSKNFADKA